MNTLNLVKKAIVLLQASNIEEEYEKYKGLYRDDSQLKYMGRLWKHYNATLFDGKIPKFKSISWKRQTSNPGALGMFDVSENAFKFLPGLFLVPFPKFKNVFVHEMCHQAQYYLGYPGDPNFIPPNKKGAGHLEEGEICDDDPFDYFTGHGGKAWNYWCSKCGISTGRTALDITQEEILTEKNKERRKNLPAIKEERAKNREEDRKEGLKEKQITVPKKYMVVKLWDGRKWVEGMVVAPRKRSDRWLVTTEKLIVKNQVYPILISDLFEVDSKRTEEILSNPNWKKGVDRIIRNMP